MTPSSIWTDMEAAGGIASDYHGRSLMRHFGDPAGEYQAATMKVAVFDRSHRARLAITGRSPSQMLNGILTGRLPSAPGAAGEGVIGGAATYSTVLTPKGKMLTDLWAISQGDDDAEQLLLDVPVAGVESLASAIRSTPARAAATSDSRLAAGSFAGSAADSERGVCESSSVRSPMAAWSSRSIDVESDSESAGVGSSAGGGVDAGSSDGRGVSSGMD